MSYWNELIYTWITRSKTGLVTVEKILITQINKKWVKNDFLENFSTNRQEGYWSIICYQLFVTFFMDRNYVCFFLFFWEWLSFKTVPLRFFIRTSKVLMRLMSFFEGLQLKNVLLIVFFFFSWNIRTCERQKLLPMLIILYFYTVWKSYFGKFSTC